MESQFEVSNSSRRELIKLTIVNAGFWFAWAMTTYQTVFPKSIGFTASQVGLMTALMSGVAIIASTFWGMVSDKIGSIRKVNVILYVVGFTAFALIPWISGFSAAIPMLFAFIPLTNFFRGVTSTFTDNLTVRSATERGLHYGFIRCTGSATFAVCNILVAQNVDRIGLPNLFPWLYRHLLCSL